MTHTPVGLAGGVPFVLVADGAMLCPAIATLITLMTVRGGFGAVGLWPRFKQSWKWYLVTFFLSVILVALATALSVALGLARVDWTLPGLTPALHGKTLPSASRRSCSSRPLSPGQSWAHYWGWVKSLAGGVTCCPRCSTADLPTHAAFILSGIIWGLWHTPLILMGCDYSRRSYPRYLLVLRLYDALHLPAWLGTPRVGDRLDGGAWGMRRLTRPRAPQGLVPGSYSATVATAVGPVGWIPVAVMVIWLIATGRIRKVSEAARRQAA